ncbi:hypothetical protein LBMAG42_32170 [Deltaproteobacteria bacterium]|nr:hypothetical protein LBMAG42_32170 [Deltaproteobacteria bacterium]
MGRNCTGNNLTPLLLILACAPGTAADSAAPAALAWPPDVASFDCTATGIPERITPVPWACPTDRACAERLVSGHRGMGGDLGVIAPEDTLAGVRAAIAYGLDYVETDPRPTADDVLVNMHDTDVSRTTDGEGEVDQMTFDEVRALQIDSARFTGDFACEVVPTLTEVLSEAKGRVHVLVDANKTDRVDLLVAAILESGTLDEAIFDTSSVDKVLAALAIEPTLHVMIRPDDEAQLTEQLASLMEHPPVIVEIPEEAPDLAAAVVASGNRAFSDVFFTDVRSLNTNSPSAYLDLYDQGLGILQSERPERILEVLERF